MQLAISAFQNSENVWGNLGYAPGAILTLTLGKSKEQRKKPVGKKTGKQRTHKGIWWSMCPGNVPRTVWGANPGTSGTSCGTAGTIPRDKRDTSMGWLQSRSGGVPPNSFMFIGFSLPQTNLILLFAAKRKTLKQKLKRKLEGWKSKQRKRKCDVQSTFRIAPLPMIFFSLFSLEFFSFSPVPALLAFQALCFLTQGFRGFIGKAGPCIFWWGSFFPQGKANLGNEGIDMSKPQQARWITESIASQQLGRSDAHLPDEPPRQKTRKKEFGDTWLSKAPDPFCSRRFPLNLP